MTLRLEHATDLTVDLTPPHEMGSCGTGTRRIIPIVGGSATGPLINGEILDVGADCIRLGAPFGSLAGAAGRMAITASSLRFSTITARSPKMRALAAA